MNFARRLRLVYLPVLAFVSATASQAIGQSTETPQISFATDILPILSNKCFVCHGPDTKEKDLLRLDSRAAAVADLGGYKAIDPQDLAKSELIGRIHDKDAPMPPEDAEKQLTAAERKLLTEWVQAGGEYQQHWAFVLPVKAAPLGATDSPLSGSDAVDAFVGQQLKGKNVSFAAAADKTTLARRVAFVLTGLPPEPDQLQAFLSDESPDAYEKYVETLFASPRFGEHQARYWLDAVRYGDTHGLHLDNRRGIYPYRDWVVFAHNKNLPLDKFITWQLAGDLLPDPTLEQLVATGFVRMNPTTAEGGAIPAEFQAKNNFDRTETLGTVLLGMTLNCARCHTHKYDPIPQTEYYRLLAFFNSTAESSMDGNKYEYGPVMKAPANQDAWSQWSQLTAKKRGLLDRTDESPEVAEQVKQVDAELKTLAASFTSTLVARDLPKPRPTHLLGRGEYNLPIGEPLSPGILTVMGAFPEAAPQNRLGLAQWLTSSQPSFGRTRAGQWPLAACLRRGIGADSGRFRAAGGTADASRIAGLVGRGTSRQQVEFEAHVASDGAFANVPTKFGVAVRCSGSRKSFVRSRPKLSHGCGSHT